MYVALLAILGLCLGSFVNAFVWRLKHGGDWVKGRSECTHCHHVLAPLDLVPVFSWLWLGGKCRYCHKPIQDSPLTELALPALFLVSYFYWPAGFGGLGLFQFVMWLAILVALLILLVYDLRWYILPDKVVFALIGLAVVWVLGTAVFTQSAYGLLGSLAGVVVISGFFYILYKISEGKWIGFGDVKLGIALGLLAGGALKACMVLFLASFIGVVVSLPLIFAGKASRKTQLPFGPLLITGLIIVQIFGADIINYYIKLLGL